MKENSVKSQSELKVKKLPKARENGGDQVVINFSFASDWLKRVAQVFWTIMERG